ncbi:MAG: hypothetical protein HY718_10640 [Planctomycetes bacterium]|nr:hypothetical protein [Planctomycetota bacterium]
MPVRPSSIASKRRWRLRWVLPGLLAIVLATAGGLWLAFQHVPAWYRPVEIAPDQMQAVRDDLVRVQSAFGEHLALASEPFEYRISQDQINSWLAAREDIWPLSREWLPPGVSEPFVTIDPAGIRLAAACRYGSVQTVLSARVMVRADENQVHFQVIETHSGSLPVPRGWLRDRLASVPPPAEFPWAANGRGDGDPASVADVLEGVSVPNTGVWWEPKRPYRVIAVRLEDGAIVLAIRPLPYRGSCR